ncbi:MAG: hypothetical protein U0R71_10345 [Solirubrobacterales bacterium]
MSPYDRVIARLAARRLDRELAEGAPPAASPALTLRAQALTTPQKRRELAASLRRVAGEETEPAALGLRLGASRRQASAARRDLEQLAKRLVEASPVAPRGVALTLELLGDGTGPLFWSQSRECLIARLREARAALELAPAAATQVGDAS